MILFLSFMALIASAKTGDVKPVKYPVVSFYSGMVEVQTAKETKLRKPKVKELLREMALLKTGAKGSLEVALDEYRVMTLMPNTEVSIPNISWETGELSSVVILSGEIFWQQKGSVANPIVLRSDLFEMIPPEAQFKISYSPSTMIAEVKVFSGHVEFSAMNSENSALVLTGKKVSFHGVREEGEVAYDILLKGRKIPKGYLGKVQDLPTEEMKEYSAVEIAKKKKADLQRLADEQARKQVLLPGQVCRFPIGKLNECSWTCLKNPAGSKGKCLTSKPGVSCVRRRCNANGIWGEEYTLQPDEGALKCRSTAVVAPCDY